MAQDWNNYYQRVLDNPTASEQAKTEARLKLGQAPPTTTPPTTTSPTTTPMTTTNVAGMTYPSGTPAITDLGNLAGLIASGKSTVDAQIQYYKDKQAELTAAREQKDVAQSPWKSLIMGAKTPEQVAQSAFAETGVDIANYFVEQKAALAELDALNSEYNKTKEAVEKQKAEITGRPGQTMDFLNNQLAQIDRNAAPTLNRMSADINSKAALYEAKQGRLKEAQDYAQKAVEAATATQKYNMDMYNLVADEWAPIISGLDKEIQNAFTNTVNQARWEYEQAYKKEQDKISNDLKQQGIDIDAYKASQPATTDPTLEAIRLLTLQGLTEKYQPSQGQLYYKNSGKVASDLPATFTDKLLTMKNFADASKGIIPSLQFLLTQPDVDVDKFSGALKEFGYQGFGRYLGMAGNLTENEKSLFDYMTQLSNEYLYARSGAQINETEQKRLAKVMPQAGLSNADNMRRLSNFGATVDSMIKSRLDIYGVDFYGNTNTPTNLSDDTLDEEYNSVFGNSSAVNKYYSNYPSELIPSWLK